MGDGAVRVSSFDEFYDMPATVVLGDNTTAAAALDWVSTRGRLGNVIDLLGSFDEFIMREAYLVEKLPKGHVLVSHGEFLDKLGSEFKAFLRPFEYSDEINRERWRFVERLVNRDNGEQIQSMIKNAVRTLRREDKELYELGMIGSLFEYSRAEVPPQLFQETLELTGFGPRTPEYTLLPQALRGLANAPAVVSSAVGFRFQHARDPIVSQAVDRLNESVAQDRRRVAEDVLREIKTVSHPSLIAFAKAGSSSDPFDALPGELLALRDEMKPVRREFDKLAEKSEKDLHEAKQTAETLTHQLKEITEERHLPTFERPRVRKLLVPLFVVPAEAVAYVLGYHSNPADVVVGLGVFAEELPEISRNLRERATAKRFGLNLIRRAYSVADPQDASQVKAVIRKFLS